MGILVNVVLLRILVAVENQEDISEEASMRLNDLCKMLHELENLFMEDTQVMPSAITAITSAPDVLKT